MSPLTLILLVAYLANIKRYKKPEETTEPWYMGIHLRVLIEIYLMNTNMTGFVCFFIFLHLCALDECSLCISSIDK